MPFNSYEFKFVFALAVGDSGFWGLAVGRGGAVILARYNFNRLSTYMRLAGLATLTPLFCWTIDCVGSAPCLTN